MDWLMLVLLACGEAPCEEPTLLQRPATEIECTEQARLLDAGRRLLTEWQGEMRAIIVSTCIPMEDARGMGLVEAGAGS